MMACQQNAERKTSLIHVHAYTLSLSGARNCKDKCCWEWPTNGLIP